MSTDGNVYRLSIVIPTYRRPEALARTLAALERQTAGPFEVLVVDDPVEDDPAAVAAVVAAERRPFAVRHLHRSARGVSAARNAGWRAARAPLVLFLGDDVVASPRLVAEHVEWHARRGGPRVGVLGHVRWAGELRVTPFMRWLDRGIQFDYSGLTGDQATPFNLYTANVSLPRELIAAAGGFDEERFPFLYEDLDLGYRLGELGLRLLYNRRAVGEHLHPTTIAEWERRMASTAPAERRWVELHPELPAYFHDKLAGAAAERRSLGWGRPLLRWLGPDGGPVGRRAWASADRYYLQRLAPGFLAAWEDAADAPREPRAADRADVAPLDAAADLRGGGRG
ncbi:MAG TPA: glycosyltransferase family 2 protein [Solirubrobacteraceae bacterium]|nr:glycosyltransferase family 2 protein [Solirubrobacteraceae bacterium]